tara:strand:+ start:16685 stop:17764 length:1080 start_codon:yes stop_codon:yes gene_type:complete
MGYEPIDTITNDDYKLWYQKAIESSVPVNVVDSLFSALGISSANGLMQLTKDIAVDDSGYLQNYNNPIQNDNQDYLNKFLSFHYDKAISLGATSVKLIEGKVFYFFGNTALRETTIPVGVSGLKELSKNSEQVTSEMKQNLISLSKLILASSRPLVFLTGSQLELRASFLQATLVSQGASSIVRDMKSECDALDNIPANGYLIVKTSLSSFTDVLAAYVKGSKVKADKLAHVFSASSGQVDFPAVCCSCGIDRVHTSVSIPEKGFTLTAGIGVESNPIGCSDCFKGYKGIVSAYELIDSGKQKLINAISAIGVQELNKSEVSLVHTKFTSDGIRTLYSDAGKLVLDGCVSFDDAKRNLL